MVLGDRALAQWFVDHLGHWLLTAVVAALTGFGLSLSPAAAGVPDVFADRPALPDCGSAALLIGQAEVAGAAVDCFDAALAAGGTAELLVHVHGVDNDPVLMYHRALPGGAGEVFMDHRPDQYRSVDWQHVLCPRAQVYPDLEGCDIREL
ncbi:hypothetical protein [Blastococcus goldschmidtiae]|uniref:Uncharacterized protein n=1 Tax=Blastococcus goldschmidtiae TaxID=3075546 RepID=A0ABU2KDS0_9ACTN|nr:hypothetical protein [Blastococcus sp. DSM 46792]MDT0278323.1 hypothetical protein [Blastococcus sp. DSM 46792]